MNEVEGSGLNMHIGSVVSYQRLKRGELVTSEKVNKRKQHIYSLGRASLLISCYEIRDSRSTEFVWLGGLVRSTVPQAPGTRNLSTSSIALERTDREWIVLQAALGGSPRHGLACTS